MVENKDSGRNLGSKDSLIPNPKRASVPEKLLTESPLDGKFSTEKFPTETSSSGKSLNLGKSPMPLNKSAPVTPSSSTRARTLSPSASVKASTADRSSAPVRASVPVKATPPEKASSSVKTSTAEKSSAPVRASASVKASSPDKASSSAQVSTPTKSKSPSKSTRSRSSGKAKSSPRPPKKSATVIKSKSSAKMEDSPPVTPFATATSASKITPKITSHDDEAIEDAVGKGMFALLEMMVNMGSSMQSSEHTSKDPFEIIQNMFSEDEIKKWYGIYVPRNWMDKIEENTKDLTYLFPFANVNFMEMYYSPETIKMMGRLYDLSLYHQNLIHGINFIKDDFPDYDFDKRFSAKHWEDSLSHNMLRHLYIIFSEWWTEAVSRSIDGNEDIDPKDRRRLEFSLKQLINSLSPSNYLLGNPEAVEETLNTRGYNLVKGMEHFLRDVLENKGQWKVSTVDQKAFEVGKSIAMTPGEVIHSTRIYELIHYTPSCAKECAEPLLIIPPVINKFYVLDMQEHNSFVKWAVDQGLSVFIMSWVNPDGQLKDVGFDDYVLEIDDAVSKVLKESNSDQAHVLGYCVGGTLLATNLARNAKMSGSNKNIASATFLTSLIDFHDVGEIDVFLNAKQMSMIEQSMKERGYFDAYDMSSSFSLLKSNDMIWSFVVNNYLLGKEPSNFDLLYWNSDSTNLTEAFFRKYMDIAYIGNKLCKKGQVEVSGIPIDMSLVNVPSCSVATEEDHIAPWESCFNSTLLLSGEKTFVLGGSGHVNGIINPVARNKYFYRGRKIGNYGTPGEWKEACELNKGSWWNFWREWLREKSSGEVKARPVAQNPSLGKAPGKYVLVRS